MSEITTRRLRLRPLRMEDGSDVMHHLNDLDMAQRMARIPHPYTADDWAWFMNSMIDPGIEDALAIESFDERAFMGLISLYTDSGEPVLGYWLGKPFWGQGVMKEAGVAFLHHGFQKYDVPSLKSGHFEDNPQSGRVLSWLGFDAFQIDEETSLARGDEKIRHVTMRLTRSHFEQLHPLG